MLKATEAAKLLGLSARKVYGLAQPNQSVAGYCKKIEDLLVEIDVLKAALAQPAQEPVATLFGSLPVYDTPPAAQRKPVDLTNDEINNIANGCHLGKSVQGAIREALDKYKEKNT